MILNKFSTLHYYGVFTFLNLAIILKLSILVLLVNLNLPFQRFLNTEPIMLFTIVAPSIRLPNLAQLHLIFDHTQLIALQFTLLFSMMLHSFLIVFVIGWLFLLSCAGKFPMSRSFFIFAIGRMFPSQNVGRIFSSPKFFSLCFSCHFIFWYFCVQQDALGFFCWYFWILFLVFLWVFGQVCLTGLRWGFLWGPLLGPHARGPVPRRCPRTRVGLWSSCVGPMRGPLRTLSP